MPQKNVSSSEPVFRSNEVARMFGVSLRQLQWWDEQRVIVPIHEGHARLWNWDQAVLVGVLHELRRKGCSLQAARKVMRKASGDGMKVLRRTPFEPFRALKPNMFDVWLVVSLLGTGAFVVVGDAEALDILSRSSQPMYVVSMSEQARRVEASTRNGKHKS